MNFKTWLLTSLLLLSLIPLNTARLQSPSELEERRSREIPALNGDARGTQLNIVEWSPDGRFIAVGGPQIWIYDAETLEEVTVLSSEAGGPLDMAWSPDSTLLAVADVEAGILVWSPFDAAIARRFTRHDSAVYALDWHPDGTAIASSGTDGMILIWDPLTGEISNTMDTRLYEGAQPPFSDAVDSLVWSPDGATLLVVTGQGQAAIFSMDGSYQPIIAGGAATVITFADWSPDGTQIALRFPATINDAATGFVLHEFAIDRALFITWSPRGDFLAGNTSAGELYLWRTDTGIVEATTTLAFGEYFGHPLPYANTIAWNPDGSEFATVDNGPMLRVWAVPAQ